MDEQGAHIQKVKTRREAGIWVLVDREDDLVAILTESDFVRGVQQNVDVLLRDTWEARFRNGDLSVFRCVED